MNKSEKKADRDLVLRVSIESRILLLRGERVMMDKDLAELYGVKTKVLNQAVRRNIERFPHDFMFQLTKQEFTILKSQIVTSSWGGTRKLPYAFTENGVAMLSSVLNSKTAIRVNIQIMRAFTRIREFLASHKELACRLKEFERKIGKHEVAIQAIFKAIHQLQTSSRRVMKPPEKTRGKIGF